MGTRRATNALVKRTTFSSAINIFPNEVSNSKATTSENINENENVMKDSTQIRPYSEVPGPKGLPLIGNSWRFAPLIGKINIRNMFILYHYYNYYRGVLCTGEFHSNIKYFVYFWLRLLCARKHPTTQPRRIYTIIIEECFFITLFLSCIVKWLAH